MNFMKQLFTLKLRNELLGIALIAFLIGSCVIYKYALYYPEYFNIPLHYSTDALFSMAVGKMHANGSFSSIFEGYITNQLNFPYTSEIEGWYPIPEKWLFNLLGLLTIYFGIFKAANIILVLTHIFSGFGFYIAARLMGVGKIFSIAGGIIFGLTPFIFYRGFTHITVGAAWAVPLMVVIISKLYTNEDKENLQLKFWGFLTAVLGAGLSPYYSMMFCQFIVFILIIRTLKKDYRGIKYPLFLLITVIFIFTILNYRYISNIINYGSAGLRNLAALEVYGLKLPELFLPRGEVNIPGLSKFASEKYYSITFIQGEFGSPYLGIIGIICCLYFYGSSLASSIKSNIPTKINPLILQSIWVILFSLVGGINLMIGVAGFQFLRATNRYSIWLLSIFLIYTFVKISNKYIKFDYKKFIVLIILAAMLFIDLPRPIGVAHREIVANVVKQDIELVSYLESSALDPTVFVIPLQVFPENGPINQMDDYEFFRIYLISNKIKMNYGAVKNDRTQPVGDKLSGNPTIDELSRIKSQGFNYILLNQTAFKPEEYKKILGQLTDLVGQPIFSTTYHHLFSLDGIKKILGYEAQPHIIYLNGWSTKEDAISTHGSSWTWATSTNPRIKIYCQDSCVLSNQTITLKLSLQSINVKRDIAISMGGKILWEGLVGSEITPIQLEIPAANVPLGPLLFNASGKKFYPGGGDNRSLVFRVMDVTIK